MNSNATVAEELARRYAHRVGFFVRKVERDFRLGGRWFDELKSAGYWGLAKAISNRRPHSAPEEFSAYVSRRILGAVMDEARACLTRTTQGAVFLRDGLDAADAEEHLAPLVPAAFEGPDVRAERRRTRRAIEHAIADLPDAHQRVAQAYLAGNSWQEIAEREGVSTSTIRARFRVIALKLRKQVQHLAHLRDEG